MFLDLSYQLVSKTGKSLYHVFGMTEQVRDYDKHHVLFKSYKYETSGEICKKTKDMLKEELVSIYQSSREEFDQWERQFFQKNCTEPHPNDMDDHIAKTHKKLINAKSIAKLWKIKC